MGRGVKYLLLPVLHARNVVFERRELALLLHARLKSQELGQLFSVVEVRRGALFYKHAEIFEEFGVFFGLALCDLRKAFQEPLCHDLAELADEGGVLHALARYVQRNVRGIYYALCEAHPFGQEPFGARVDENLFAVERDFALGLAEAEAIEKKAEAQKKMGEASIIEMYLAALPEVVKNAAEPLAQTDRIVMYGDGNPTRMVRDVMNKNVIYVFHSDEQKDKDGNPQQRLLCEGAARNIVWQPCDFGGYVQMIGNTRVVTFTPTQEFFAKGCYGIEGQFNVPSIGPADKNEFLTNLFEKARANIEADNEAFAPLKEQYDATMIEVRKILDNIKTVDDANAAVASLPSLNHALTSKKEASALLSEKAKELGFAWDKTSKGYIVPAAESVGAN